MPLTIVAQFQAKPDRGPELETLLRALVPPTRAEEGCEIYELHRSLEDPEFFHFHEIWSERSYWDAHMESAHLLEFKSSSEPLVEDVKIFQMELVV